MDENHVGKRTGAAFMSALLVATVTHETWEGKPANELHLPPAGITLMPANSSATLTPASIVIIYDAIREAEYVAPADERPLERGAIIKRST